MTKRFNEVATGEEIWLVLAGQPTYGRKLNHQSIRKLNGRQGKSFVPGNPPVYGSEEEAAAGLVEMLRNGREIKAARELAPAADTAVGKLLAGLQDQHAEADARHELAEVGLYGIAAEFDEQLEELRKLDATYAQAGGRWGM